MLRCNPTVLDDAGARAELKDQRGWERYGFIGDHRLWSDYGVVDTMPRIDVLDVSPADFAAEYERQCRPVVIVGAMAEWPALQKWNLRSLKQRFGPEKFKIGEDDDGYSVKVAFKDYCRYLPVRGGRGGHRRRDA